METADLDNRFMYHPANTEQRQEAHEWIRDNCLALAHTLNRDLPEGREKSLAITKLEEVMFWSNASIARSPE